jgi:hypothetical protein
VKYIFLLNQSEVNHPDIESTAHADMHQGYFRAIEAMAAAGVLIDCAPIHDPSATTTVRIREGETLITDGPSAEIKEFLGGYTLVDCDDLDDALKWAAMMPAAALASVEVRPVVAVERPS